MLKSTQVQSTWIVDILDAEPAYYERKLVVSYVRKWEWEIFNSLTPPRAFAGTKGFARIVEVRVPIYHEWKLDASYASLWSCNLFAYLLVQSSRRHKGDCWCRQTAISSHGGRGLRLCLCVVGELYCAQLHAICIPGVADLRLAKTAACTSHLTALHDVQLLRLWGDRVDQRLLAEAHSYYSSLQRPFANGRIQIVKIVQSSNLDLNESTKI